MSWKVTPTLTWNETVWNPSMIQTALWLDAADASTVTTVSGAVSQWNDKSGNGRNVTQSSSAARPVVASTVINNLNVIRFDGTDDRLSTENALYTTSSIGLYAVLLNRNLSNANYAWGGQWVLGQAGRTIYYFSANNGTFTGLMDFQQGASSISASGSPDTGAHIFEYETTGANAKIYYEGAEKNTSSSFPGVVLNTPFTIGGIGAGPANSASLDAAEIICLSAAASTINRQKLEGYLAWKWGLTANLPAGHPYKTVGPTP